MRDPSKRHVARTIDYIPPPGRTLYWRVYRIVHKIYDISLFGVQKHTLRGYNNFAFYNFFFLLLTFVQENQNFTDPRHYLHARLSRAVFCPTPSSPPRSPLADEGTAHV